MAEHSISDKSMQSLAWQTHYFGRFRIDLPKGSENSAYYKIYNEKIDLISKNGKADITKKVEQLIDQLRQGKARGTYSRYEKTIPLDNGSTLVLSKLENPFTLNSFFLSNKNTLYRMTVSAINDSDLDSAIDKMRLISNSIYFRVPQEAPPSGAFAIEAGYLKFSSRQPAESLYMGSQIAGHPGTYVSLLTQRVSQLEEPLLTRFESQHPKGANAISELIRHTRTLRKQNRVIGKLPVQEVAIMTEAEGRRFYNFQLEYQGTVKSNTLPYIALELGTHEAGSNFKSDEEALAFWDQVIDSFSPIAQK